MMKHLLKLVILCLCACSQVAFARTTSKKRVCFIVNPISGTGKQKKIHALIKDHLDLDHFSYKVFFTKGHNDATRIAEKALSKGYDIIVAVGGDGTIHEVAQAVISTSTPLAMIPTGSGNGLARNFKIPTDIGQAIEVINLENDQWIDTVKINQISYIGVAGIGFDAEVSQAFADIGKRGLTSYIKAIMKEFPHYEPQKYELIIDGEPRQEKAFLICFANSKQYGNNVFIAPQAEIDDGYLDVIILKEFPKSAAPKLVRDLFNRHIDESKYVMTKRCQEVIIKHPVNILHVDGEPMLFEEDVYIRVLPSSLKILTPSKQKATFQNGR